MRDTQTPGKYPEDNLSLQQHGESLKTRILFVVVSFLSFYYVLSIQVCLVLGELTRFTFRAKSVT
jgi:hypothetical protein